MWLADVPQAWSKFTVVSEFKVHKFNTCNHIRWLVGCAAEKKIYRHRLNKAKECAEAVVPFFFLYTTLKVLSSMRPKSQNRIPKDTNLKKIPSLQQKFPFYL